MSKSEARSCRHLLKGVKEQLDLVYETVTSAETASAEAAVRFMKEISNLQNERDLNQQRTATAERSVTALQKEAKVPTAMVSDLMSENVALQKELEASFKTHAEVKDGLAKDHNETHKDLGKATRENDALKEKIGNSRKDCQLCVMRPWQMNRRYRYPI